MWNPRRTWGRIRPKHGPNRGRDRGQAAEIAWSFAVLVAIGLVYLLTGSFFGEMKGELDATVANETAQRGLDYTASIFNNFLVIVVIVSVLGIIALAVYQSGGR